MLTISITNIQQSIKNRGETPCSSPFGYIIIKFDLYFIPISAACSPYFYAMFSGFDETNKSRITLKDVDPHALEILINYVYTSEVEVTEDNVQTLLPAANLMQLSDVKEACCEFLLNQLHPTNCLGIKR